MLVNRRFGRWLAAVAHVHGLRPNQVTLASGVCSATAIAVVATGSPSALIAVSAPALLLLGYALDASDGQLARLQGGGSASGEWLDHIIDSAKLPALHLAVAVFVFRDGTMDESVLLVPLAYAVVEVVGFGSMILRDLLSRTRSPTGYRPVEDHSLPALIARLPLDYGCLCMAFVLTAWLGAFVVVYVALFTVNAVYVIVASRKWFHEMRALDRLAAGT